ncbi:MAG: NAD-glutamate dehydrogenase [Epsilonproteobacteria bacterium]|nr:NAD-glutamate dehydrogenase [Campylobacterota bacterium]
MGNYAEQIIADFNKTSLEDCIIKYTPLFALFRDYFVTKFDPALKDRDRVLEKINQNIIEAFKKIESINDDRMLKLIYEILQSIVRTNYFKKCDTIALKFDVSRLTHILKGVQPHYETFVYANDMKGTHLRVSTVCRGGLRWSNRMEDFRTEVKSLMTTQEAKNSVIVPKGAKGGFVITKNEGQVDKKDFEGYYTRFINALLDVVDNQVAGEIVRDPLCVSYDQDDPYFVVAADRGTSSMSDTANAISKNRGFWLLDAFASGSSNGYHHKKLGVTAKGAIKASQRFFIEEGIDFYKESISIVGVGSMSGDVFGNGLLESPYFRLVGAISSDEVFIDPNPDLEIAYGERQRLFAMKRGKWSEYDQTKISTGGGVFKRASKSVTLTPEIQVLIKSDKETLNGEELAKALLQVEVDMLYFGGIGTYVKSSSETNISLGDKNNEFVRIDADEVNAKVVCEGANLALTMPARMEYAMQGGKINLDSIDNSAGVDTSDHEVNLKILLNALVEKEILSSDEKDSTLQGLSSSVVESVMWTNYLQSLSISLDTKRSVKHVESFTQSLTVLEKHLDTFKRSYFDIPKERDFDEVIDSDGRVIRPVIATMTLYAKILLQDLLSECTMFEEEGFFERYLFKYFPKSLIAIYENEIKAHPLRKEITSMIIANKIINFAGATFIKDLDTLGVEKFMLKIKAYLVINQLFNANDIRYEIYRNDYTIAIKDQYYMLLKIEDVIEYNVQWMLKSLRKEDIRFDTILEYKSCIFDVIETLQTSKRTQVKDNELLSTFFANLDFLRFSSAIIKIKQLSKADLTEAATLFYTLVQKLEIALLIDKIETISSKNVIQDYLKVQLEQLLEFKLVYLTEKLLQFKREGEEGERIIENYFDHESFDKKRYDDMIAFIKTSDHLSLSDLSVTVNTLLLLR